jgi:hypothetical protein
VIGAAVMVLFTWAGTRMQRDEQRRRDGAETGIETETGIDAETGTETETGIDAEPGGDPGQPSAGSRDDDA